LGRHLDIRPPTLHVEDGEKTMTGEEGELAYRSQWMTDEIEAFRGSFQRFLTRDLAPHAERWRNDRIVDRSAWRALGDMGALLTDVPEEYGGLGATFAYEAAVTEDLTRFLPEMATSVSVHSNIVAHYVLAYGSEEQKKRWLPRLASGEWVGAIAMTEPGTGSDLQSVRTSARRRNDAYVINGAKTFITSGQLADLVIVVARTSDQPGAKGLSLIVLEAGECAGFRRGRNLDKIGMTASDTSELFFDNAEVPLENLLGEVEGQGFVQLMQQLPRERLGLAVGAVAAIEAALDMTVDYTKERRAFKLAERKAEAVIARVFIDWCVGQMVAGDLDAVTASIAKLWCTDKQVETADECLQLHGGYGYMKEFPIARLFVDSRVQKIYGGTNEIMKLLISRSL
jgi:acyl-CoA dehydrogenase